MNSDTAQTVLLPNGLKYLKPKIVVGPLVDGIRTIRRSAINIGRSLILNRERRLAIQRGRKPVSHIFGYIVSREEDEDSEREGKDEPTS